MDNLLRELEELTISHDFPDETFWKRSIELIQRTFVPVKIIGLDRPCEEKDFREYRMTINRNLQNIQSILRTLDEEQDRRFTQGTGCIRCDPGLGADFIINLMLLIGEQSEKSIWNTAESVDIARDMLPVLLSFSGYFDFLDFFTRRGDNLSSTLMMLRPKLLKETWKTYPAAVTCYKWLLHEIKDPILSEQFGNILPTALMILDDFVPENRLIGLNCVWQILQHSDMKKKLMETGYADVLYDALKPLTYQRDVRYIVPLYNCFHLLLTTTEFHDNIPDNFEWSKVDDIIATLLDNMECEQDMELRHAYILSLPEVLLNIGCAKWLERVTRVLSEYCGNHTDLRTLKVTLKVAQKVISMFTDRLQAHCTILYTAFLNLHFDLTETPVFDKEIIRSLVRCMRMLYNVTPDVGEVILRDGNILATVKNCYDFVHIYDGKFYLGDPKYCD